MLRAAKKAVEQLGGRAARATQLQQQRFLNVHEYQVRGRAQKRFGCDSGVSMHPTARPPAGETLGVFGLQGAQLMETYGINVPPGIPVFKLSEVEPAVQKMKDAEGLVRAWAAATKGVMLLLALGCPLHHCKGQSGRYIAHVILGAEPLG